MLLIWVLATSHVWMSHDTHTFAEVEAIIAAQGFATVRRMRHVAFMNTSHVTHVNESCTTYESEPHHTHEWVLYTLLCGGGNIHRHTRICIGPPSAVADGTCDKYRYESRHTYESVMSHTPHIDMSHVTRMNASCHTHTRGGGRIHRRARIRNGPSTAVAYDFARGSRLPANIVGFCRGRSRPQIFLRNGKFVYRYESRRDYIDTSIDISHATYRHESHHILMWVTLRIDMSHSTYRNESCHIKRSVMPHIDMSHARHRHAPRRDRWFVTEIITSVVRTHTKGGGMGVCGGPHRLRLFKPNISECPCYGRSWRQILVWNSSLFMSFTPKRTRRGVVLVDG